jgi:hypothetical protein
MDLPTTDTMQAAADAEIAILRAQGVPIPQGPEAEGLIRLGFAAGAQWCINEVRATFGSKS